MPGIVIGAIASPTNPLLPFFYQKEGKMADLYALRWEAYEAGDATIIDSDTINTSLIADGGDKISTGYYAATFDPKTLELDAGAYEIVWYYKSEVTSAEQEAAYKFEVLDSAYFKASRRYESYLGSDAASLSSYSLKDRQQTLAAASTEVDRLTGRFFFPRFLSIAFTIRPNTHILWLDQPIIGVQSIVVSRPELITASALEYAIGANSFVVYNRHLNYLLSPDDRDDPKIELVGYELPDELICPAYFPQGAHGVTVAGVYGYTDPDGSPFGQVPAMLQDVVLALAYRKLADPTGSDPFTSSPGKVKSAKTRDQSVAFHSQPNWSSAASLTGDERLDAILTQYMSPPFIGAAG